MKRIGWVFLGVLALAGCKKDEEEQMQPAPAATEGGQAKLAFTVDGQALQYDQVIYMNAAGNPYGVSRLQFYLSEFEFEADDGTVYRPGDIVYVDARAGANTTIPFDQLPFGHYRRLSFYVGLDSAHNITGALPHTVENENMAWPDLMGGGYHIMKLEGNFVSQSVMYGFAMHMGRNENRVPIVLVQGFTIGQGGSTLHLEMNINEWFANPYTFDFNVDGNYTMGDSIAMGKLAMNGPDVFTLNP